MAHPRALARQPEASMSTEIWLLVFLLLVMKIPLAYVAWVIWWAVKAVPEPPPQGEPALCSWRTPWRGPSPRSRRPPRGPAVRSRRARRQRAAARSAGPRRSPLRGEGARHVFRPRKSELRPRR